MKRDIDLSRQILLALEKTDGDPRGEVDIQIEGYYGRQVNYHIMILHEAGLLEAENYSCLGMEDAGFEWRARHLTWAGHDFLDAARNDTIWQRAKEKTGELAGSVSFDLLKAVLTQTAKDYMGLAA